MADFNSSLPTRTENPGDVIVKVADATTPSQQLKVNADGTIDVNASFTATDLDIRDLDANQDNVAISDGTDTLAVNVDGSINAIVSATNLDIRDLTFASDKVDVSGSSVVVSATDLDVRDLSHAQDSIKVGDGADFLAVNTDGSINVKVSADIAGDEINNYNTAAAVGAGASSNHDYTVTALKTLLLSQIEASGSGKAKIEVQIETGVATGVFNSRFVQFNSTSSPNMSLQLKSPISVAAGVRVRVIRTNRENQAQDLFSTISGQEV